MRRTHRLLLPWLLARLGARAFKAPRLSVRHREAVGAVARRSSPCLRRDQRVGFGQLGAVWRASRADAAFLELVRGVVRPGEL